MPSKAAITYIYFKLTTSKKYILTVFCPSCHKKPEICNLLMFQASKIKIHILPSLWVKTVLMFILLLWLLPHSSFFLHTAIVQDRAFAVKENMAGQKQMPLATFTTCTVAAITSLLKRTSLQAALHTKFTCLLPLSDNKILQSINGQI